MVNNQLSVNHHQKQQTASDSTVMMMMVKNGNSGSGGVINNIKVVNNHNNGQQHQEDQILEVNLIGVNSNGAPDNVLGDFSEFLDTGQLSDIVMRCSDGRYVECHRLVLAARANNLRHFLCGRNYLVSELVFRNCVKFEHLQALVNLIYRGHINGANHQITSTLWKLFKIFGVRVTAQCFTSGQNGQKELAHQLKYESVETNVEKGALKFEKIIREFRSETRRKVRRPPAGTNASEGVEGAPVVVLRKKKSGSGQPGVIVISDDEHAEWSSASCSSSISSLSSSSSDVSVRNGFDGHDGEAETITPRAVAPQRPRATQPKQQNGNHKPNVGPSSSAATGKSNLNNSNSALKAPRNGPTNIVPDSTPELQIQEVKADQPMPDGGADNWDSSGSSEGEYVETDYKSAKRKPKIPTVPPSVTLTAMPACLKYNQNEMSIIVKSVPENKDDQGQQQQRPNEITPKRMNPVKDTESEAIICSPQILFNIKPEPIDDDDEEEEGIFHEGQLELEDLGHHIKMEIVEEEENYEHITQDRYGRRLPPPLLIPLQTANRQQRRQVSPPDVDDENSEEFTRNTQLEKLVREMKPHSKRPANFPPFILRNPRGNQTRTYTTDNLWAALMDVKSGESIYRASQQHKVPRKTLRNWMKRCHIKSAYPMPSQLKEAAEKKKLQKYYYQ